MIIPLVSPSLARSSDRPGSFGRAVLERFPIWSCSVRGFACHPCYHRRGALLPHLFTLTFRLAAHSHARFARGTLTRRACPERGPEGPRRTAVYFLCHCPSG